MKTERLRNKIIKFLQENGPQDSAKILDHLNDVTKWGSTPSQVGNILSKNKDFRKVGSTYRKGILSGSYEIAVWALKD